MPSFQVEKCAGSGGLSCNPPTSLRTRQSLIDAMGGINLSRIWGINDGNQFGYNDLRQRGIVEVGASLHHGIFKRAGTSYPGNGETLGSAFIGNRFIVGQSGSGLDGAIANTNLNGSTNAAIEVRPAAMQGLIKPPYPNAGQWPQLNSDVSHASSSLRFDNLTFVPAGSNLSTFQNACGNTVHKLPSIEPIFLYGSAIHSPNPGSEYVQDVSASVIGSPNWNVGSGWPLFDWESKISGLVGGWFARLVLWNAAGTNDLTQARYTFQSQAVAYVGLTATPGHFAVIASGRLRELTTAWQWFPFGAIDIADTSFYSGNTNNHMTTAEWLANPAPGWI